LLGDPKLVMLDEPTAALDTIAEQAGTNGYEILTRLGPRYARAYTA